jgi:hypothetical protein
MAGRTMEQLEMSLPKWTENSLKCSEGKLIQALYVAWKALEYCKFMDDAGDKAKEAMRRIEEMGK